MSARSLTRSSAESTVIGEIGHGYTEADAVWAFYREAGAAGPPVVLLHKFANSSFYFRPPDAASRGSPQADRAGPARLRLHRGAALAAIPLSFPESHRDDSCLCRHMRPATSRHLRVQPHRPGRDQTSPGRASAGGGLCFAKRQCLCRRATGGRLTATASALPRTYADRPKSAEVALDLRRRPRCVLHSVPDPSRIDWLDATPLAQPGNEAMQLGFKHWRSKPW